MSVGAVSFAAPITTTGVPGAAAVAAPVAGHQAQAISSPNAQVQTGYSATPAATSGGGLAQDIGSAVSRLTQFAQTKMEEVNTKISALFNSEGGPIDAAKLQAYNSEMSKYEMTMQAAAKIQEKQDQAIQVWLR